MALSVAALTIYPVKSCRGIAVDAWPLDRRGLRHDRRFMIVRKDGKFVTQRELPKLALIETAIDRGAGTLRIAQEGEGAITVPLSPEGGDALRVEVWGDEIQARTVGDAVDRWLSAVLGETLRLVYFPDETIRPVDPRYAEGFDTGFADGYPLLVVSQASLDELNARLAAPVTMERFRPNLVVGGALAFAEDGWREVSLPDAAMRIVKPCARCVIVTTDQATAARDPEPLRTLATFRRRDNDVLFGQNAVVLKAGLLRVGDALFA